MADDDIEMIECSDNDSQGQPEKPLVQLIERLIGTDIKQNTVLTNAQIIEILQTEFEMDVLELHELELEIYLNIMKKFLKDWPQWNELDRIVKRKHKKPNEIQEILTEKYNSLKQYLKLMLDTCKPMAQETVTNTINQTAGKINNTIDTSDVVMEIHCTRQQLNNLIFRQPVQSLNNTIFNISESTPSRIIVLPLETILNWWNITLSINIKSFQFTRIVSPQLKHVLVNKKLQREPESNKLDQELEILCNSKVKQFYAKKSILDYLDKELKSINKSFDTNIERDAFGIVLNVVKRDFEHFNDVIQIPANYRRFAHSYKYVRYLYKDTSSPASRKYDLQLEETLAQQFKYLVNKFEPKQTCLPKDPSWLTITCNICSENFSLNTLDLLSHHVMLHGNEPDWMCTNCNKICPMSMLAKQSWHHECET